MLSLGKYLMQNDIKYIDPKYSLIEIIQRIVEGEEVMEDPEAAFKDFKVALIKLEAHH